MTSQFKFKVAWDIAKRNWQSYTNNDALAVGLLRNGRATSERKKRTEQ